MQRIEYGSGGAGGNPPARLYFGRRGGGGVDGEICCAFMGLAFINNRAAKKWGQDFHVQHG